VSFVVNEETKKKIEILEFIQDEDEESRVTRLKCKRCDCELVSYTEDISGAETLIIDHCNHFTWFVLPYVCFEGIRKDKNGRLTCNECIFEGNREFCSKLFSVTVFSMKTRYCILLLLDKDKLKELK